MYAKPLEPFLGQPTTPQLRAWHHINVRHKYNIVNTPISKSEAKRSAILRNPWRYFIKIGIVCFVLGLIGVGAAVGSDRHIHPEWSVATFVLFGVGLSFVYAAFLSFVGVGCGLIIAYNKSGRVKRILRFVGLVPLTLSVVMLLSVHYGGGDPVARLISLLPFMYGISIVLLLGLVLLSCMGWRFHSNNPKEGEQCAYGNPPSADQPPHKLNPNTRLP